MSSIYYSAGTHLAAFTFEIPLAPIKNDSKFKFTSVRLGNLPSNNDSLKSHGSIIITRYSESPSGPYDELLFVRPSNGPLFLELENYSLPRITRCFVSTPQALQIARDTHNVPAVLANFEFKEVGTKFSPATSIQLSLPLSSSSSTNLPFFAVIAVPFGRNLNLPRLSTPNYLQPPLLESFNTNSKSNSNSSRKSDWLTTKISTVIDQTQATKFYPGLEYQNDCIAYEIQILAGRRTKEPRRRKLFSDGMLFDDLVMEEGKDGILGSMGLGGVMTVEVSENVQMRREIMGVVTSRSAKL